MFACNQCIKLAQFNMLIRVSSPIKYTFVVGVPSPCFCTASLVHFLMCSAHPYAIKYSLPLKQTAGRLRTTRRTQHVEGCTVLLPGSTLQCCFPPFNFGVRSPFRNARRRMPRSFHVPEHTADAYCTQNLCRSIDTFQTF